MRRIVFMVFSLFIVVALASLGFWQMSRGAEKESFQQELLLSQQQNIVDLDQLPPQPLWHGVILDGEFDNRTPILLDNQLHKGQPGYYLYLPFHSQNQWVLVNLGWIAAPPYRSSLPEIPIISGQQQVTGIIAPARSLMQFKPDLANGQWPLRVQNIDLNWLGQELDRPLLPWVVQIDANSALALKQNWRPIVMAANKHYGYAVQWFLMAVAVSGMALWWLREGKAE